jgi:hypothetical protein
MLFSFLYIVGGRYPNLFVMGGLCKYSLTTLSALLIANLFAQWQPDVRLTSGTLAGSPARTMAAGGSFVHVVWGGGGGIYYKRSTDDGVSWGPDTRLTFQSALSVAPTVSVVGSIVNCAWHDFRDGNAEIYYKRSTNGGVTWGNDMRLTNNPAPSTRPCISGSGSYVHVVWWEARDGNWEIYYKRSTDGGTNWGADVRLTINPAFSEYPSVSASGMFVHVAWCDDRDGNMEIYYKRSTNGGTTWGADIRLTNNSGASFTCPHHIESLKNGPELRWAGPLRERYDNVSTLQRLGIISLFAGNTENRSEVTIKLSKEHYKKYEPIPILFQYVNKNDKVDSILPVFYDILCENGVRFIVEGNNRVFSGRNIHFPGLIAPLTPAYFLAPHDTLRASMILNHSMGERAVKDRSFFKGIYGYFEPGKYKVRAEVKDLKQFQFSFETNELEFEVSDLNAEDSMILNLLKGQNYGEITAKFPDHPFAEYASLLSIKNHFPIMLKKKQFSKGEVKAIYNSFFEKYPMSFYFLNMGYAGGFLTHLFVSNEYFDMIATNTISAAEIYDEIKDEYKGTSLETFMRCEAVKNQIVESLNNLIKSNEF